MDIKLECNDGKFKLRASGIIVSDGKILVHKGKKFDGYCFPGGHVEIGETTGEAIIREIKEELNLDVKIDDIFCINENIYTNNDNKVIQEINYYYKLLPLCEIDKNDFEIIENDKGVIKKHEFCWLPIRDSFKKNLQPIDISNLLIKNFSKNKNILISDYRNNDD